ncbi:Hypothetical predicted protein [Paramuricea clavata]|uniref:Major facilitator superfamily associated domain-containing protein n=1 Tax=Paramuricea clavata TaxID=317549 RepID=A0A7D9IS89_PARCT|nr:Hypothetical predicted protein [Paramuricea clavata]
MGLITCGHMLEHPCTLIVVSAIIAWRVRIKICGLDGYGYFASFLIASFFFLLSLLSLPFFKFKYETDRTINWMEIKSVVLNGHYIYMYILTFHLGACVAFQVFWEFWYLDGLQASPLVMGAAALIRRPVLAAFLFTSCYVIERIGELNTVCVSLLLFTVAFFALSFSRVYWYVLAVDTLHSAGYGLAKSAFTLHFSKAGSKASSGVILGFESMCFILGVDCGATFIGLLFHAIGVRSTLLLYAGMTAIMLAIFLCYLKFSKHVNEYEKLPVDSDDDVDNSNANDDNKHINNLK